MTIQLQEIASVIQGVNLTRVGTSAKTAGAQSVEVLTLKEFNESMGIPYRLEQEKDTRIWIEENQLNKIRFTEENMVVIHLLSQRTTTIPLNYEKLLIPSNFVVVDFQQQVDVKFFEWYFNEHVEVRRQIQLATQGSSVSSLSISMLRQMEMSLPPIQLQMRIGKIVQAVQQKKRLTEERMELEDQYIHELLSVKMEESK
ncbi:restriction endonuclease subunit S [Sporosarcina sp. Marseille-Q4063]|uniref:restriction endonuclease subunit S n=1 Tax=Sporosarcina sp. Marseille-Q4063 TaxID=2810514 RepID=UPI001BAFAFB7|nr:restriction endonuclease subunit S [Sporosarcina sp. Marseille-Q4063]QUW20926.1 restriction endonuclease subunit S [Sporosarcina sp. Marseille-Q4063]